MKNKKAFVVWKNSLRKIRPERLREMRKESDIPEDGFSDEDSQKIWEDAEQSKIKIIIKDGGLKSNREALRHTNFGKMYGFIDEIKKECPEIQNGFDEAIEELLQYGNVINSTLEKCNATGCKFDFIGGHKTEMEKGVYIKVGPDSTIFDIQQFLKIKGSDLEWMHTLVYKNHKKKRVKEEKFDRNNLVYKLNQMSLNGIKLFYKELTKKDDAEFVREKATVGVMIMSLVGDKMEADNFRQVARRVKKRGSPM